MSETLNLKTISTIDPSPFRHLCVTIGELPSAFIESMSYYELLAWFVNYLENTVIPAVNANGEATAELQEMFVELKDYVDNYFENLDVQEEINNKLDEMAEAGTLQEIIAAYLQANVAWTFDTVADMKLATNLVDGSYARTLGFRSVNDGGGAVYRISDTGTADEMAVIAVGSLYATIVLPSIVSPEMFGAYGDGTHDDTAAWNKAVSVKKPVLANQKKYLTGKISVTDTIDIDCGNAEFLCSADTLFEVKGEIADIISNGDYTSGSFEYTITHSDYNTYTGMAVLIGNNNFQESRDYYVGGFVCKFKGGKIDSSYPVDVTNTQISIINPVSGSLKNIKDIKHTAYSTSTISINVVHGCDYKIENVKSSVSSGYKFIQLSYCLNCHCDNLNVTHRFESDTNNSYIVDFDNTSFCSVTNSILHNDLWHAITTGGIIMDYHNLIDNCELTSFATHAYSDHDNARKTIITNSKIACCTVSGMAYVENVDITPVYGTYKRCQLRFIPTSAANNAEYVARNVRLHTTGASQNYTSVESVIAPQVNGKTYYIGNIELDNIKRIGSTELSLRLNIDNASNAVLGHIVVNNCNMQINLKANTYTHIDSSNYVLDINNCNDKVYNGNYIYIGGTSYVFNEVNITNSHVYRIQGSYVSLNLDNVSSTQQLDAATLTVTGSLTGSNVKNSIKANVLLQPTVLKISDMRHTDTDTWFNICKTADSRFYQHMVGTTMTTVEITS